MLNSLSVNGNNVRYASGVCFVAFVLFSLWPARRYWLFEGCYKYETYGAKEWVKPCPSHVMCSVREHRIAIPAASVARTGP